MDDEKEIRDYVRVIVRHWKIVVAIVVIAVIAAVISGFISQPVYKAKSSVLVLDKRAEIIFEPRYRTSTLVEDKELKQALIALVKSSSVAASAIDRLGDTLKQAERNVIRIQNKVSVNVEGDLIEISAKSSNPGKAAEIANAWAEAYIDYINGMYSGTLQSPEDLRAQAEEAKKNYQEKQRVWESFVSNNRVDELKQLIGEKRLLVDIKYLREKIAAGTLTSASAVANHLAIILLQVEAFTEPPFEIQLNLDMISGLVTSVEEQLRDIDSLISSIEARTGNISGQSIDELRQDVLHLQGELEQEYSRQQEALRIRDVAWETYILLDNEVTELELASQAQDVAVSLAVPAVVPNQVSARPDVKSVAVALIVGLIIGVLLAFVVEYFKPEIKQQTLDSEEGPAETDTV